MAECPFPTEALFDFEAQAPGDLAFRKGDRIIVLQIDLGSQWWYGRCGTRQGNFPSTFVQPISPERKGSLATRGISPQPAVAEKPLSRSQSATTSLTSLQSTASSQSLASSSSASSSLLSIVQNPSKPPRRASGDAMASAESLPPPLPDVPRPSRLSQMAARAMKPVEQPAARFDGTWRLVTEQSQRYKATIRGYVIVKGDFVANEWIVYAAGGCISPHSLHASALQTTFTVNGVQGAAAPPDACVPDHVAPLLSRTLPSPGTPASKQALVDIVYVVQTNKVSLAQATTVDAAAAAASALAPDEREMYVAPSAVCQIDDPRFRAWLEASALMRGESESVLDFAYRVLTFMNANFKYSYPPRNPERQVCDTLVTASSDCGGLSVVFVSVMRANGIPARCLVGRWLLLPNNPALLRPSAGTEIKQQYHVKADFYVDDVGWVPVDPTTALESVPAAFANESGNFLVQHVDMGLQLDSVYFGRHSVVALQDAAFWLKGYGNLEATDSRFQYSVERA